MYFSKYLARSAQKYNSRWPRLARHFIRFAEISPLMGNFSKLETLKRLVISSAHPVEPSIANLKKYTKIQVLIVAHEKDFGTLPFALKYAMKSIQGFEQVTSTVVVPDDSVEKCAELMELYGLTEVSILGESRFVPRSEELRTAYKFRYGWVLQQLIKISAVLSSEDDYWLIVDADTLLLRPRLWLDDDGVQILTPSWEFHRPYYDFLSKSGFTEIDENYSFVSHHMFIQRELLAEAFLTIGVKTSSDLVDLITTPPIEGESPFSLDYELYGQFLLMERPNRLKLAKWSNCSYSRTLAAGKYEEIAEMQAPNFASISFHDYL